MELAFQIISFFFSLLVLVSVVGTYEEVKKLRKKNEETQDILKEIASKLGSGKSKDN